MRMILPLAVLLAVAPGLPSCNDGSGVLLAKQVEDRGELVGGPVAMADVGDFLLQNDQIRVNILGAKDSPGPGVFGGSIVDVDLRRARLGFGDGLGRDRFAEMFPVANLLVPFPKDPTDVKVLKDGSDGKEASIRVEGKGAFLFEALAILQHDAGALATVGFPDIKTSFHFRTDYILRPGERHVLIHTAVMEDISSEDCPDTSGCAPCEFGLKYDDTLGCPSPTCECGESIPLDPSSQPVSVFGQIFGDQVSAPGAKYRAGVTAGDFVFFGNQNNIFAPGAGFDTDTALHDAFYAGRNTFQTPLTYDFVAAAGGDVSYGYFTVDEQGATSPVVNVPIFSSSTTAFISAGKNCLIDGSDDDTCDSRRAWTFDRYLAVGDGDVASVADDVWRTRGTPTGTIRGVVQSRATGEPSEKAHVFVFTNPVPGHTWRDLDELVEANLRALGSYGLANQIDADVGLPLVLDGHFQATLPPGDYVLLARTQDGMGLSKPQSFTLEAGATMTFIPAVTTPGRLDFRVADEQGALVPAKVTLISLDERGDPLEGDGKRRIFLGDGRLGNGARAIEHSPTGQGSLRVEAGRYRFRASRGPEYSIYERDFTIAEGGVQHVDANIAHEVDTTGWMSADTHLHSTMSFDSGMPIDKRLATLADEHVEYAVATDHDVQTDYNPYLRRMLLEPYVATAVGDEVTTIEQGHFIGFPLEYDATILPAHGAFDPTCRSGGDVVNALRTRGGDPNITPFVILPHPRDGFFGYIYQLGVDPFTMKRKVSSLEAHNPGFETASCDYDAMEVLNAKRFDMVRTTTVFEMVNWTRCRAHVDAAKTETELVCPEVANSTLAKCLPGERFDVCKARARNKLAWEWTKRILTRTPEEQQAHWEFTQTMDDGQALCEVMQYKNDPVPMNKVDQPCTFFSGTVDDYFRYLEHGMLKTQVGASDSHDFVHEPGYPRTYFKTDAESPQALKTKDVIDSLHTGRALPTMGPFITATIGGKTFGELTPVEKGKKTTLDLTVQTASWFGVDRIEIYMNGLLAKAITQGTTADDIRSTPADIVDFKGKIELDVPPDTDKRTGDSWVVIIAMGLQDQNLLRPVVFDLPYGEIQISKITADAFSLIPAVASIFPPIPMPPDWYPMAPYAVTNAILLDGNNNQKYDAPLPYPEFCSQPCDPNAAESTCPPDQVCLMDVKQCGMPVYETCERRIPWPGGEDALDSK